MKTEQVIINIPAQDFTQGYMEQHYPDFKVVFLSTYVVGTFPPRVIATLETSVPDGVQKQLETEKINAELLEALKGAKLKLIIGSTEWNKSVEAIAKAEGK